MTRWSIGPPLGYLCLCVWYALRSQVQSGPASERWLPVQGLTLPWGVAVSYLPGHDAWSDLALAGVYLGAAVLNAYLFFVALRLFGRFIGWLEKLDDRG